MLHDPPSRLCVGRGCGSVLPDPGQRISGDVQHPAAVALPRRQPPNHKRGDAIPTYADALRKFHDDAHIHVEYQFSTDRFFIRTADGDEHEPRPIDITDRASIKRVFDAAAAILGIDVAVDSAGDGVSGPADNTLRRLRDEFMDALADHYASHFGHIGDAAHKYTTARDRLH